MNYVLNIEEIVCVWLEMVTICIVIIRDLLFQERFSYDESSDS